MCMQQQRADEHESVTGIRTHSSTRTNGLVHLSKFTCDKPSITACMLVCLAVLMTTLIAWHAIELLFSSNVALALSNAEQQGIYIDSAPQVALRHRATE